MRSSSTARAPSATALNPTVLLEVTSDSSEAYDTGTKLECYETIPSLSDYLVVSQRERRLTIHQRTRRGEWSTVVESLGLVLSVDEVYRASAIR